MPAKVLIIFLEITSYYHGDLSKRNCLFDIDSSPLAARELFLLMQDFLAVTVICFDF